MKKIFIHGHILVLVFLVFSVIPTSAKDQDKIFKSLQISYSIFAYTDYTLTQVRLHQGKIKEGNPIAKLYIKKPVLCFAVTTASNLTIKWLSSEIYKKNKKVGYIAMIGLNLIKIYIIYHNIRL